MESKATKWSAVSHLPGYEWRLNDKGHRETRPRTCKFFVGDRVKWSIQGAIEPTWFIGKIEEVHGPGDRPFGVASDMSYPAESYTYIVSRVNSHGHTSRYWFDEATLRNATEGQDALMTRGEALAEAKNRWGDLGGVFDRDQDSSAEVRKKFPFTPRFWVGENNTTVRGHEYGNGVTWEEAFMDADNRKRVQLYGD